MYERLEWVIPQIQAEGNTLGSESFFFGTRHERTEKFEWYYAVDETLMEVCIQWNDARRDKASTLGKTKRVTRR
jgi:hypothetical protein